MSENNQPPRIAPVEFTPDLLRQFMAMTEAVITLQTRIEKMNSINIPVLQDAKVYDPEPFYGNRDKLRNFISHIRLVIRAQPSRFTTENQKVVFISTLLRGSAFS